jgi:hypothetical protein
VSESQSTHPHRVGHDHRAREEVTPARGESHGEEIQKSQIGSGRNTPADEPPGAIRDHRVG